MSNPGDFGQNPAGAPQFGQQPQQQPYGQPQAQQPYGQPQQQWGAQPGYGAPVAPKKPLPYTIREFALMGVGVLILLFSFFDYVSVFGTGGNVWQFGGWQFLVIGPVIAVALIGLRPFVPAISRVGSLSIDQFASVAFSVAGLASLSTLMSGVSSALAWAGWLMLLLTIAGVVLTVGAPFIPGLREEFDQRPEEVAPRAGRTTRVIPEGKGVSLPAGAPVAAPAAQQNPWGQAPAAAPAPENPWAAQQQVPAPAAENPWAAQQQVPAQENPWATPVAEVPAVAEPVVADVVADAPVEAAPVEEAPVDEAPAAEAAPVEAAPAAQQPFWALVPEERAVVDASGAEIFRVGPTAWALVVEDNGSSFVIRHDDGRTGTLTDVSGVVRN